MTSIPQALTARQEMMTMSPIGRNKRGLTRIKKPRQSAFSMVEMMIAVVIVSACLLMALRVFSICAAAVSEAYSNILALNILEEKMDELQEKSILEDGISISSQTDSIAFGERILAFSEEIVEWEIEKEEEEVDEEEETEEEIKLRQATLRASWSIRGKGRGLTTTTLLPAKGYKSEF